MKIRLINADNKISMENVRKKNFKFTCKMIRSNILYNVIMSIMIYIILRVNNSNIVALT